MHAPSLARWLSGRGRGRSGEHQTRSLQIVDLYAHQIAALIEVAPSLCPEAPASDRGAEHKLLRS